MARIELNKHAETIRQQVFHTFPYHQFVPNFKGPHADDCPGCIIEAELQILVDKIAELSPVEDIIDELIEEKRKNARYIETKKRAFERAGKNERSGQPLEHLVRDLVEERDNLNQILKTVTDDLDAVMNTLKRRTNG